MSVMERQELYDAVIMGGGPVSHPRPLPRCCGGKKPLGGQITITAEVVNYPGVARTSGTALTEAMRQQAQSFGAEILLAEVQGLQLDGDIKTVHTIRGGLK